MATVAGLVVRIAGDTSELRKEINATQRQLNSAFGTKGMALSRGLVKGMAAAGAAMSAMGIKALAEASKLQKVQVAFTNLLGSAQKADEYIRKLYDFANQSPFSFEELSMGAQRLMAMGYSGEEALTTLRAIGDAAAGIGKGTEGISRISLALGQIKAKGTVQAEEMRQLAENGIPAWQMLADAMGVDVATAMKQVEKRAVSAQVGIDALTKGMTEKYGGMMEQQAKTIEGGWQVAMDGVQRVLAQTGLKIDETFNVAGNLRGFGLILAEFSDEINQSGVIGALDKLVPTYLQSALIGVAGAITGSMIPALLGLKGAAIAAMIPFAKFIAIGAVVGGIAHLIAKGMEEVRASRMQNGVGADSYSTYDADYHDKITPGFDDGLGGLNAKETLTTNAKTNTDTVGDKALLAAAQRTSKAINDEWIKMFKHRTEAVDRWYSEEKKALDKSASENATYQTDLTRLNELYVQKRLEALREEAEDARKIREDVSNLSHESKGLLGVLYNSKGKQELEQMKLDQIKAIEDIENKWLEQQNNFISMTKEEKEIYLKSLDDYGIAYQLVKDNELSFAEQIAKEKYAVQKKYIDEETEYLRQAKDVQADIEKAYANNSLGMLKQALAGEKGERLQAHEENQAILSAYEESWREAHMGIKERLVNTITETKDSLNTFFQDILSYGGSFSESLNTLLSGIGSSILNQVTSAAAGSITNGLMGLFGGGEKEGDSNPLATDMAAASVATKDLTKGLGLASNVLGNTTGLLGIANTVQGVLNTTTKPAEATATVAVTGAMGALATAAISATVALKAMAASGLASPLKFLGAATGGAIYGAGTGTSDSIPAMLSNGEYVIRAAAVDKLGVPFLDALNTGDYNGFSTGGLVTPSFGESGKAQNGGGSNQPINISLTVNTIDASGFEGFLQNGGLDKIKQALLDSDRNYAVMAGVW